MPVPSTIKSVPSRSVFKDDIFAGKTLFVTGGGSGICYAQTEALCRHGCDAVIFGRRKDVIEASAKRISEATGRKCVGLSGDVRSVESLEKAVKETVKLFGKIDFVIAGAAGNFLSSVEKASSNAFKTVIEIDLLGTYNTLKATLPELKKTNGSIIAISATLQDKATLLQAHAASAKAGVDTLIRTVALEYGPFGIRANTIAPGFTEGTEGFERLSNPDKKGADGSKLIPLQRYATTDDLANAAIYLFSPAASYITGTQLIVDGGEVMMKLQNTQFQYPDVLLKNKDFRNKL